MMKKSISILVFFLAFAVNAQQKVQVVDASCGQCNFGLKTQKGCDVAVKIDGKAYFVDGINMDKLGDAHAHDGMCSMVRKAKITGEIVGDRYKATSFKLLPVAAKK